MRDCHYMLQQDLDVDDAMYKKLQAAISEVENSKREAHEEFYKRQKAEKDLAEAMRKVRSMYSKNIFLPQ